MPDDVTADVTVTQRVARMWRGEKYRGRRPTETTCHSCQIISPPRMTIHDAVGVAVCYRTLYGLHTRHRPIIKLLQRDCMEPSICTAARNGRKRGERFRTLVYRHHYCNRKRCLQCNFCCSPVVRTLSVYYSVTCRKPNKN